MSFLLQCKNKNNNSFGFYANIFETLKCLYEIFLLEQRTQQNRTVSLLGKLQFSSWKKQPVSKSVKQPVIQSVNHRCSLTVTQVSKPVHLFTHSFIYTGQSVVAGVQQCYFSTLKWEWNVTRCYIYLCAEVVKCFSFSIIARALLVWLRKKCFNLFLAPSFPYIEVNKEIHI